MEIVEQSEEYAQIGYELMRSEDSLNWILEADISVGFLKSDKGKKNKGRIVFGDCHKVPDRYKCFIPYDFLITIYERNIIEFNDKQVRALIHHELLHVGDGMVNPHDIEEFYEIMNTYGLDWSR